MGFLSVFSKPTVLSWTLVINILFTLFVSAFRHNKYGSDDSILLYFYTGFTAFTLFGVVLKRRSWVYLGVVMFLIATWVSFWYFFNALKQSTSESFTIDEGLNPIDKMVAVHWPLHIFNSIKDFILLLVLSTFYQKNFDEKEKFNTGTSKFLNLLIFGKPMKATQMLLLVAHTLAFLLMMVDLLGMLHHEEFFSNEGVEYIRLSSVRQTILQILLLVIISVIIYGICRNRVVLMTLGYVFHGAFCLFALVDMIMVIRGQDFWFSSEKAMRHPDEETVLAKGVVTFAYSLWLCRILSIYSGQVQDGKSDEPEPENDSNPGENDSLLPK